LANGHTRSFFAGTILSWPAEDLFYFLLIHIMLVDVR
jgi:hypothetical protein